MKLNTSENISNRILNNHYFILGGAAVAVVALVIYMWLDTRNIDRSRTPEAKPISQISPPLEGNAATAAQAGAGDFPRTIQRGPGERKSSLRPKPKDIEYKKPAEVTAQFFRKQANTRRSGHADDWMFSKGKDIEGDVEDMEGTEEQPMDSDAAPPSE